MLIKCPECGHDVSTEAEVCMNCGFPMKNLDDQISEEETVNPEMPEENLSVAESLVSQGPGNKKSRRGIIFALAGILSLAVILLIVFLGVIPASKRSNIRLPHGIEPGMSLREAHQKMEQEGFSSWKGDSTHKYYVGNYVMGKKTDYSILYVPGNGEIRIRHSYTESGGSYNKENPGSFYKKIVQDFTDAYGTPEEGGYVVDYQWRNGDYYIKVWYLGDNSVEVVYDYDPEN